MEARHAAPEGETREAVTPAQLVPGTRLTVEGIPGPAVVVEAPDRRGRVAVRVGGARLSIPLGRVERLLGSAEPESRAPRSRVPVRAAEASEASPGRECDLRGLRVDEALDRADAYLQRVLGHGEPRLILIHGHGTGALRKALRAWLRERPEVADFGPGEEGEGGNGITFVRLTH